MNTQRQNLQAAYQAAKETGDWKTAGHILIQMSSAYPCTCAPEVLQVNQGHCTCNRYAYLLRKVTPEELMLSGC